LKSANHLTISAFAKVCGVSAKTLRFYDDIGLFRPEFVDARTRYRLYVPEQLAHFARIQAMRDSGMSLADICAILGTRRSSAAQRALLQRLRALKLRGIDEARRTLAWIEGAIQAIDSPPALAVSVRYVAATTIASIRAQVNCYEDIHPYERALASEAIGRPAGGLRGVLWHRCADGGLLEGEPFVEVTRMNPRPRAGVVKELPATHVARAFSSFDDDEAEETYVGLSRWIRNAGFILAGSRREIYRGSLLEIQYPLASA
jgi:DNA-binding transcriptional MerR regulator